MTDKIAHGMETDSANDIEQLKARIVELEQQNTFFKLALKAAHIGVWEYDVPNNQLTWSDEMFELYGIKDKSFVNVYETWHKAVHPSDIESAESELNAALAGEKKFDTDFRVIRPDGTKINVHAIADVHFSHSGEPLKMLGVNVDSTSEEAHKQALAEKNNELAAQNTLLNEFAYIVSHDLKEPVRTLRTFASHLLDDVRNGQQERAEEDLKFINKSSKRIDQMINDILEYSRAGNAELVLDMHELNECIDDVVYQLDAAINENAAVISVQPDLPEVFADRAMLERVFLNLINNALKFRREDITPIIDISLLDTQHSAKCIELSVKDNGIGIPAKNIDSVFGAFKRCHSTKKYPGTGIGLAVVKKVLERHGGGIRVRSEEGRGTEFILSIPRLEE